MARAAAELVPSLGPGDLVGKGRVGIRAQLVDRREKRLVVGVAGMADRIGRALAQA